MAPAYKAPTPQIAAYNWSGFYAGVHGGYAWGTAASTSLGGEVDTNGFFGGGQAGFNWQAQGSPVVFGIEVDSAFANIEGGVSATIAPVTTTFSSEIDYLGTARVRLGYAWDRVLGYVTGGVAWANNEVTFSAFGPFASMSISDDQNHLGWTIGGGFEWALADAWTAKVEYLYIDLGSEQYFDPGGFDGELTAHTVKLGLNYRFGFGKGPVVANY